MSEALARAVLDAAVRRGSTIAAAESCTGGMIAVALADIAGSSAVFERGFVTYANAAKEELLGVPADVLARHGAVSAETAAAMAGGALRHSPADLAVAVTGVAGPGGGRPDKPVGLVWFATAVRGAPAQAVQRRFGDLGRAGVRRAATDAGLELLLQALAE